MSAETSGARAALRYPDFRRYAFGRFFATMAWQMLGVAVGWQVYAITRDPLDLGLVGLAQFLPFLQPVVRPVIIRVLVYYAISMAIFAKLRYLAGSYAGGGGQLVKYREHSEINQDFTVSSLR